MTNDNTKNEVLTYQRSYNAQYVLRTRTATDGRGSGGTTDPLQSQGSLTLSGDHDLLFAVNSAIGPSQLLRNEWLSVESDDDIQGGYFLGALLQS